ncbi:hypothetical protein [Undibacterium sp. TJN19]|uniref:hypothetical protein n=1 Tax=Undibacterium sp. TJN19 TaxID=3413055 RepID=UPI003BF34335
MHEHKLTLPDQAAWQSIVSFVIACLITALLLFQLVRPWHKNSEPLSRYIALDLSLLPALIPTAPAKDDKPADNKMEVPKKTERQARKQASPDTHKPAQAISLPASEPQRQDTAKDLFTEEKPAGASTLRIDRDAVARAYKDSRSDIQKLAGRAGQPLEATERSQIRQFGREVHNAKISDCIKANGEGISIGQATYLGYFAAAALAYNAVTGKCK